jgi:hypothetical protein
VVSGTCPEGPTLTNPLALHDARSAVLAGLVVHTLTLGCAVPLALRGRGLPRGRAPTALLAAAAVLFAVKILDLSFATLLATPS